MTDPLTSTETEGGLNSADTLDWKDEKSPATSATRMFIWFVVPIVAMLAITLAAFAWKLTSKPAVTAVVTAPAVTTSDKDAQIAQLQSQIQRLQGQLATPQAPVQTVPGAVAPVQPVAPVYSADAAAIAQLSARLDRLETNQRALSRAATAAYAAAALEQKAHTSDPFLNELAAVEPAFDDASLTVPLRTVAEHGVESEAQLAVDFPQFAARANIAAKQDDGNDDLFNRARHAMGSFVSVRRTDKDACKATQGILQCAEADLNRGDLDGALAYLNTLSPSAQKAIAPWLSQARARARVDTATRRITQISLQRLVQANDGSQATTGGAL